MISTDVQSLARAAPEPAASSRSTYRDDGSSFDQFLQAVTPDRSTDRSTNSDASNQTRTSESYDEREAVAPDRKNVVQNKPVDRKTSDDKKLEDKPVEATKNDEVAVSEEKAKAEAVDDSMQETIAAALAAQLAMAAVPVVQTEAQTGTEATAEVAAPAAVIPTVQTEQTPVIQLPDVEPQPLPDELKQATQQTKVETKGFETAVDAAKQNLENQASSADETATVAAASTKATTSPELKNLNTQEPTVKLVEVTAQPEDISEMDAAKITNSVYALAAAKTDNLVQPKTLPMIQKISHEVIELAREQGKSMRIQIQPENMGKIDLRLVSNSDGMRIVMTTEIPATGKLLESHMDQLQRQLADAGVSISGMSVNSQGTQGQSANTSQNQSLQGLNRTTLPIFQQEAESISPVAVQVSLSGLDYRV
jgi:flagellar hook-length control protein FliK